MRLVIHTKRGMFERKVPERAREELRKCLEEAAVSDAQYFCINTAPASSLVIGADLLRSAVYEILED